MAAEFFERSLATSTVHISSSEIIGKAWFGCGMFLIPHLFSLAILL
jgi:hypothetical protein